MTCQTGFDMDSYDTQQSLIQKVMLLPLSTELNMLSTDSNRNYNIYDDLGNISSESNRITLKPRTEIHLKYAHAIGFDNAVNALCSNVCMGRKYETKGNMLVQDTDFMQLIQRHEAMFSGRYTKEVALYNQMKQECLDLERMTIDGVQTAVSNLIEKKKQVKKQSIITQHMESVLEMFRNWMYCTYWVYQRNRIINDGCDETGRILSPIERLDYLADLNELLLDSTRDVCLLLLQDLRESVQYGLQTESLLNPNNLLQCIGMTLIYVPAYLQKKPVRTTKLQLRMQDYIAPKYVVEEERMYDLLYINKAKQTKMEKNNNNSRNVEEENYYQSHLYDPSVADGDEGLSMLILNDIYPSRCIISLQQHMDWTAQL